MATRTGNAFTPTSQASKFSERDGHQSFRVLMDAVRCCSLGQITNALFEVGGQYRRSM